MKKIGWFLVVIFAVLIGIYPLIYFIIDRKFGLLGLKPDWVLSDMLWNCNFYIHIVLGGIALAVGWSQFSVKLRKSHLELHKKLGKIYVFSVFISALTGIYIAFFATGGWVSTLGFVTLGVLWFILTFLAYRAAKNNQIDKHKVLMVYSYAACFAAVTLRIWLPILHGAIGDFLTAYRIVSWLCWVPNLIVARWIVSKV